MASAASELMTLLRLFVDLVVLVACFSIEGLALVDVLNVTSMYTLGLTIAMVPFGRSVYAGMVMLGVNAELFPFGSTLRVGAHRGRLEDMSLTRVTLVNERDDAVVVPQNLLTDCCASVSDAGMPASVFVSFPVLNPRSAACEVAADGARQRCVRGAAPAERSCGLG
jgi:hypothetical protein